MTQVFLFKGGIRFNMEGDSFVANINVVYT